MSKKLKIMILQTRHLESISFLVAELIKAFPRSRYHISLVYLEGGEANDNDHLADECIFLGLTRTDYKGLRWRALRKIRPFLENNHFDVVIANMYKPMHLLMQLRDVVSASLCIGIIHAFGEFDRLGRRFMMWRSLDPRWRVVGVSAPVQDYLISARCGLTHQNTLTINNAVDLATLTAVALSAPEARSALKLPESALVFGTVGRCVKGKRHLELLKAFHTLCSQRDEAHLVIVGGGDFFPVLQSYVFDHSLQAKVTLAGNVENAAHYMRAFDVFVFPSEHEGFGVALIEAMALGLPVIVNDVEPLTTIAQGCGISINSACADELIGAMDYYCSLPANSYSVLAERSRTQVREHYDVLQYRERYLSLVEQHFTGQENHSALVGPDR